MAGNETYIQHVGNLEQGLAGYAKKSFEGFSTTFLDGGEIHKYYSDLWGGLAKPKLLYRTPIQRERDRILYSPSLRKQTEKYHILFNGTRRIVRNYTTHTMRMTHVARSICRALQLNSDFAEAIALGSKLGATPFIHATKSTLATWATEKIREIDNAQAKNAPIDDKQKKQFTINFNEHRLPYWLENLKSTFVFEKARRYIPWAAGKDVNNPYTSGQESYWLLTVNSFTVKSRGGSNRFTPETMYGIWRHSKGMHPETRSFMHRLEIENAASGFHQIEATHCTYEATVVQYADDITWIIENLSDAHSAALLNNHRGVYDEVRSFLNEDSDNTSELNMLLANHDTGGLYTYFITDFTKTAGAILNRLGTDGCEGRVGLREMRQDAVIRLSPEAENHLDKMCVFLNKHVFEQPRIKSRKTMLEVLSKACVELLYNDNSEMIPRYIDERARLEGWAEHDKDRARQLINEPVHKVQLAIDIFSEMSDQEIYDLLGIQAV